MLKAQIKKYAPIAVMAGILVLASTHVAHADFLGDFTLKVFTVIASWIANLIMTAASWLVSLTGVLLNVSMYMTTHIGDFVDTTAVIYTVWGIIRDLSSMILIFIILWAAIQMIIGVKQAHYGDLIKSIIIMGILINFSFFFTRVLIDVSNIVSLEFYNAIAPANTAVNQGDVSQPFALTDKLLTSGGIADIFMQSLKVSSWYTSYTAVDPTTGTATQPLNIILIGIGGTIVMVFASLSFLAAAAAGIVRLAMLIFLLAFSPIWIASIAMPGLKKYTSMWTDQFWAQLIFLPVYLMFMYVAIRILTESNLNSLVSKTAANATSGLSVFIGLFVGFAIVIFMINLPLFAAAQVAGKSSEWSNNLYKGMRDKTRQWTRRGLERGAQGTYQGTVGRAASALSRSEGLHNFAANWKVGGGILTGLKATGAGYEKKLDAQVKARTEFADSLGYDQRRMNAEQNLLRQHQARLARAKQAGAPLGNIFNDIAASKDRIRVLESSRADAYANRVNSRSIDTLYSKRARKNKVGAAKIQIPILEKELKQQSESLSETRQDIKQLVSAIRNNPGGGGVAPGTATPAQTAELTRLRGEEVNKLNGVRGVGTATANGVNILQNQIDALKLIK